jgi:hypothetical protein
VMECDCAARLAVVNDAVLPVSATVPSTALPSLKATLPVGIPELVERIVAVKVTDCPKADGFAEETSEVEVGADETLAET